MERSLYREGDPALTAADGELSLRVGGNAWRPTPMSPAHHQGFNPCREPEHRL